MYYTLRNAIFGKWIWSDKLILLWEGKKTAELPEELLSFFRTLIKIMNKNNAGRIPTVWELWKICNDVNIRIQSIWLRETANSLLIITIRLLRDFSFLQ